MDNRPKTGERYRDRDGRLYQVVTLAARRDTGECLVIYQALQEEFEVYALPLEQFARGEFAGHGDCLREVPKACAPAPAGSPDPELLAFLDAGTLEEKLELLENMRGRASQRVLDGICVSLDLRTMGEDADERLEEIRCSLLAQLRYDGSRLR